MRFVLASGPVMAEKIIVDCHRKTGVERDNWTFIQFKGNQHVNNESVKRLLESELVAVQTVGDKYEVLVGNPYPTGQFTIGLAFNPIREESPC